MEMEIKQSHSIITIDDDFTSNGIVSLQIENRSGGASTTVPLSRLRHMVNNFPPVKASQVEIKLYDALELLVSDLYADGISRKSEKKAQMALLSFQKVYGKKR